jgi:phosphotransferase system enzyme I (PtsI)
MSWRKSAGEQVRSFTGIGASPGIAIGKAFVLSSEGFHIFAHVIPDGEVEREIERFHKAITESKQEIRSVKEKFSEEAREPGLIEIFDTHIHLLEDVMLMGATVERIRKEKKNAEYVFSQTVAALEEKFLAVDDEYFRQRVQDIRDVSGRVLRKLVGKERRTLSRLDERVIVIAHDLTPAETASMDRQNVVAFATDVGGRTSHASIMAKALGIPAVVGLQSISTQVSNDEIVILDGVQGAVVVAPDEQSLNDYQLRRERFHESERLLAQLKHLPAQTLDGRLITLSANVDLPEEVEPAIGHGAEGVGLLRTEFLFLNRTQPPGEDEQAEAYSKVAKMIAPHPVTIRTLDVGGDKLLTHAQYPEANPFMGCRAIRLCLNHPELFKPQLRAILRAGAVAKNVKVLFPMITGLGELRQAKAVLDEVKDELRNERFAFDERMPVGVMIETPSAAIITDLLAPEVDFFSIGSNDLIQYMLAIDRVNERIAHLYEPTHPAVLRMLKSIIDSAERAGVELSICGEIAGDLPLALVLLGFGMKTFSMAATMIPEVKKLIRSISYADIREMAFNLLNLATAEEVRNEIQRSMAKKLAHYSDYDLFVWSRA